jgi:hypothetical protein
MSCMERFWIHVYVFMYICTYIQNHIHICIYIYIQLYTGKTCFDFYEFKCPVWRDSGYMFMYLCICTYIQNHIHIYIYIYIQLYTGKTCFDFYEFKCPVWTDSGDCDTNKDEMMIKCRKTCGFCTVKQEKVIVPEKIPEKIYLITVNSKKQEYPIDSKVLEDNSGVEINHNSPPIVPLPPDVNHNSPPIIPVVLSPEEALITTTGSYLYVYVYVFVYMYKYIYIYVYIYLIIPVVLSPEEALITATGSYFFFHFMNYYTLIMI